MTSYEKVVNAARQLGAGPRIQHNPRTGLSKALVRTDEGLALVWAGPMDALTCLKHVKASRARAEGFKLGGTGTGPIW